VNPTWDVDKHSSRLLMKVQPGDAQLVFEIKNKNALVPDELIGSATLDLAAVTEASTADRASPLQLPVKRRSQYIFRAFFLSFFHSFSVLWVEG